jgi:MFS family permease
MLVPLNSSMIAVALPDVMHQLDASLDAAQWLITGYLITMATVLLIAGKIGDQFGRRRLIIGGLVYFGLVSALAPLSPSLPVLIFVRMQQAVAGALVAANGLALGYEIVPEQHRGADFGLMLGAAMLAGAFGPPIGGALIRLVLCQATLDLNSRSRMRLV